MVAFTAQVMADLEIERTISQCPAISDTHAAPYAFIFINRIFIDSVTDLFAYNRIIRAAQFTVVHFALVVAVAVVAIAADIELVYAFNGGRRTDTCRCAASALDTLRGIDLVQTMPPVPAKQESRAAQQGQGGN
jgi:hypothetical protein